MKHVVMAVLAFVVPTAAWALSDAEKVAIATRLNQAYPAIVIKVESQPVIAGDKDPVLFRISPSGKAHYGNLFLKGRYDIIYKPDANYGLGAYLCTIADEFVQERRRERADFLPPFSIAVGPRAGSLRFEITGDQDTLRGIVYAILLLWDFLKDDYGKFNIFVRGYADRGPAFHGQLMAEYPYHDVSYFPLADPADPLRAIYVRRLETKQIAQTYTNAELPNLRATFLKHAIDRFLAACRLTRPLTTEAVVLNGAVIDAEAPDYRSIDLYFYAYR